MNMVPKTKANGSRLHIAGITTKWVVREELMSQIVLLDDHVDENEQGKDKLRQEEVLPFFFPGGINDIISPYIWTQCIVWVRLSLIYKYLLSHTMHSTY